MLCLLRLAIFSLALYVPLAPAHRFVHTGFTASIEGDTAEGSIVVGSNVTIGDVCVGGTSFWPYLSAGSCGHEFVEKDDGTVEKVQLKCYASTALNMAAKASSGVPGKCYIPRTKRCTSDDQCRPGTRCLVEEGSRPPSLACLEDSYTPQAITLEAALGHVRKRTQDAISALARTAHPVQEVFDKESELWSPLFAPSTVGGVADRFAVFQQVLESFREGKFKDMGDTSRSGATFMWSGDRRFIAKTVRPDEFETWTQELLPDMARLLQFDAPCTLADCSYASRVTHATALNIPVLGFKLDESYFLVLPVTSQFRWTSPPDLGRPTFYDVKPLAAHSHQRSDFLRWLRDFDVRPARPDSAAFTQLQWSVLTETLRKDIAFLRRHDIVDYSFLMEVYEPGRAVLKPGPQCVSLGVCGGGGSSDCRVLCLNIIDYTLKYDTVWKTIESQIIRRKWDNYDSKADGLIDCVGNMGFGIGAKLINDGLTSSADTIVLKMHRRETVAYMDWMPQIVGTEAKAKYEACSPYVNLACDDIALASVKTKVQVDGCFPHGQCQSPQCTFAMDPRQPQVSACATALGQVCRDHIQKHFFALISLEANMALK